MMCDILILICSTPTTSYQLYYYGSDHLVGKGTGGNTTATAPPKAVDTDKVVYWICGPPIQGASIRTTLLKDQRLTTKNGSMTTSPEQIFVLGVDDR